MRLGLFDHFGWAVAVTADGHEVVDRRRIELIEPRVTQAPIHYNAPHDDLTATATLVAEARASIARATAAAFDELAASLERPITAVSLRIWPDDFPTDLATLVRPPWESRADAVTYRQVVAEVARTRGWRVDRYDAKHVVQRATDLLGERADDVLNGPRQRLGPPWTKDHRIALAAAILAG